MKAGESGLSFGYILDQLPSVSDFGLWDTSAATAFRVKVTPPLAACKVSGLQLFACLSGVVEQRSTAHGAFESSWLADGFNSLLSASRSTLSLRWESTRQYSRRRIDSCSCRKPPNLRGLTQRLVSCEIGRAHV